MDRYYLEVPEHQREYALRYGAQLDPITNKFFIEGDIPEALEAFSIKRPDRQTQARIAYPTCPQCGSRMVEKYSRRLNAVAWHCIQHPQTHKILKHWIPDSFYPLGVVAKAANKTVEAFAEKPSRNEIFRVTAKAADVIGKCQFAKWMFTPNSYLDNKQPAKLLGSVEGVGRVSSLLDQLAKSRNQ